MIEVIIGIDDTDNIDSKGTGSIAQEMGEIIEKEGYGKISFISRHQHFIHPDVPYTSHNSSMIFTATIKKELLEDLKLKLEKYLQLESADGSDPGFCVGEISKIKNKDELFNFGRDSKVKLLTKEQAYTLAKICDLYLVEKGGTGVGVIGAIAGVALRLEGKDGEVRGGIDKFKKDEVIKVSTFLKEKLIEKVVDENMNALNENDEVLVAWKIKPIIYNHKPILLVAKNKDGIWTTLKKDAIRLFGDKRMNNICDSFAFDVQEELIGDFSACCNCKYRRWTSDSFVCLRDEIKST